MFQSLFTVSRKPSESFAHWIECDPEVVGGANKYMRAGPNAAGTDIRMYDHCRTTLAVGGHGTAGVIIGELWQTYDVLFAIPRSDESTNYRALFMQITGTAATAAAPCGVSQSIDANSTWIPIGVTNLSFGFPPSFPAGTYDMYYSWTGGSAGTGPYTPAFAILANGPGGNSILMGAQVPQGYPASAVGPPGMGLRQVIKHDGVDGVVISFPAATLGGPSGTIQFQVNIYQRPLLTATPSEIFDPQGINADTRYKNMMDEREEEMKDEEEAGPHVMRSSVDFALVEGSTGSIVTDLRTKRSVEVQAKTAATLLRVKDALFDLISAELLEDKGHAGRTERSS